MLSSPECRTRDTGLLALERVEIWTALQGTLSNAAIAKQRVAQIHQRMQQNKGDKLLVFITHDSILRALTGRMLAMREFGVMLPSAADGTYTVAGSLFIK